jgi:hypothetical protein
MTPDETTPEITSAEQAQTLRAPAALRARLEILEQTAAEIVSTAGRLRGTWQNVGLAETAVRQLLDIALALRAIGAREHAKRKARIR